MKYFFISDIHGNIEKLEEALSAFEKENADKLVILGDTLAMMSYTTNVKICELLNQYKDRLLVIRGNCDSDDIYDLLDVSVADLDTIYANKKFVTITHGNYYNYYSLPPNCGEIFIQGHTHVPMLIEKDGQILANPGSIGKPRGADLRCYIILDDEKIVLKALNGNLIKEIALNTKND